ncbi:MAG: tRNA pseudouridine(38-40) synthase TruA [Candidatus Latescibacterota bacterium]
MNVKCIVEYDGTDFFGWQKQQELRTVQGVIEQAIAQIFGRPLQIHGAGRTDAGVHAWGQVFSFAVDTRLSAESIGRAVNSKLPPDVRIRKAQEVAPEFHARFSALRRRYIYYVRTEPTAIWRRFFHVTSFALDAARMKEAARYLLGENDFASFTPAKSSEKPTNCSLSELNVQQSGPVISFTLEADRFLHHMVRVIVGTLIEVGRGRIAPEQIEAIMSKKDRAAAGPTLSANGLFLLEVEYDE